MQGRRAAEISFESMARLRGELGLLEKLRTELETTKSEDKARIANLTSLLHAQGGKFKAEIAQLQAAQVLTSGAHQQAIQALENKLEAEERVHCEHQTAAGIEHASELAVVRAKADFLQAALETEHLGSQRSVEALEKDLAEARMSLQVAQLSANKTEDRFRNELLEKESGIRAGESAFADLQSHLVERDELVRQTAATVQQLLGESELVGVRHANELGSVTRNFSDRKKELFVRTEARIVELRSLFKFRMASALQKRLTGEAELRNLEARHAQAISERGALEAEISRLNSLLEEMKISFASELAAKETAMKEFVAKVQLEELPNDGDRTSEAAVTRAEFDAMMAELKREKIRGLSTADLLEKAEMRAERLDGVLALREEECAQLRKKHLLELEAQEQAMVAEKFFCEKRVHLSECRTTEIEGEFREAETRWSAMLSGAESVRRSDSAKFLIDLENFRIAKRALERELEAVSLDLERRLMECCGFESRCAVALAVMRGFHAGDLHERDLRVKFLEKEVSRHKLGLDKIAQLNIALEDEKRDLQTQVEEMRVEARRVWLSMESEKVRAADLLFTQIRQLKVRNGQAESERDFWKSKCEEEKVRLNETLTSLDQYAHYDSAIENMEGQIRGLKLELVKAHTMLQDSGADATSLKAETARLLAIKEQGFALMVEAEAKLRVELEAARDRERDLEVALQVAQSALGIHHSLRLDSENRASLEISNLLIKIETLNLQLLAVGSELANAQNDPLPTPQFSLQQTYEAARRSLEANLERAVGELATVARQLVDRDTEVADARLRIQRAAVVETGLRDLLLEKSKIFDALVERTNLVDRLKAEVQAELDRVRITCGLLAEELQMHKRLVAEMRAERRPETEAILDPQPIPPCPSDRAISIHCELLQHTLDRERAEHEEMKLELFERHKNREQEWANQQIAETAELQKSLVQASLETAAQKACIGVISGELDHAKSRISVLVRSLEEKESELVHERELRDQILREC